LVDGVAGTVFDLVVNPDTLLTSRVFAPASACSGDSLTVVWDAGGSVPDQAGVEFWTSSDGGSYVLSARKTYPQATPLFFGLRNNAATGMSYFCRVVPPRTSGCMPPTNSDTFSTAITRLPKPAVSENANILQITNADTTETYTWQRLDSTGAWVSALSGISDTLARSGTYRVQGTKAGCVVSSDTLTYTKATTTTTTPGTPADSAAVRSYPNPAHNVFILDSLSLNDGWATLEIIDA
jgi:hypothetical protein